MHSIIIADSHHLFREALCGYLRHADPKLKVTDIENYHDLKQCINAGGADIVLLDSTLTGWNGQAADLYADSEDIKFGLIIPLMQGEVSPAQGIAGIFPRSLSSKAFMRGIAILLEGKNFFPSLEENAVALDHDTSHRAVQDFNLTGREKEVLSYLVKGASNKDIARALDLQVVTVKLHVRGICRKMKASNRTQAALSAKEHGWA